MTERGTNPILNPLSTTISACAKNPAKPHINAYKDTACTKDHNTLRSIKRMTDWYKPSFAKIGIPITGANNINLIVSSFGKYH